MKKEERRQLALAAINKAITKEFDREKLAENVAGDVSVSIEAKVNGRKALKESYDGRAQVNPDSVRNSSSTPNQAHLVAVILAKLNEQTRLKILNELPEEFIAAGCHLPAAEPAAIAAAEHMLGRLRAKRQQDVKGAINFIYTRG